MIEMTFYTFEQNIYGEYRFDSRETRKHTNIYTNKRSTKAFE